MKERDVVLVAPNTLGSYKFEGKNRETLALGVLGAYLLKEGVPTELIDARLDHLNQQQVLDDLVRLQPKVVGLTLMGPESAVWSQSLTKLLKEEMPETHVVAGSYFPTLETQKCFTLLPKLDSIANGEGEETLVELTFKVKNKLDWSGIPGISYRRGQDVLTNPRRKLILNLDTLPPPVRYAQPEKISKVSLEGSRGCFARCTFCSIGPHTDPVKSVWRGKSAQKIVEELAELRKIYPSVDQFRFVDDDFLGSSANVGRIQQLVNGLLDAGFSINNSKFFFETQSKNVLSVPPEIWEKFHKAGLYQVFFGIETASEEIKRKMAKPSDTETDTRAIQYLRDLGINVTYSIIMFTPWSNMTDILRNVSMLRKIGDAGLDKYFSEMILTPGTKAYEMVAKEGRLSIERIEGLDYYSFPLSNSLESLRRIGRFMLESPRYKPFLEEVNSIYNSINLLQLKGHPEQTKQLRGLVDQINFEIFMKVVDAVQESQGVLENPQIGDLLLKIIPFFEKRVTLIQSQIWK